MEEGSLKLSDEWILNKLNKLILEITNNIENYDLGVALDKIYNSIEIPIPQVNIVRCKYDNDSNLIGALANYKKIYNY